MRFHAVFAVVLYATLGGCASYPTQTDKFPAALVGEEPQASPKASSQVVIVRILTGLDEAAAPDLRARLINEAYYGRPKTSYSKKNLDLNTLDQSVAKTTFYGFQVFEALRTALPEATVIPQPVSLTIDGAGMATFTSKAEVPTPTVVVDFFAYIPPDWVPGSTQPFATMGRTVVPIYTIRTAPSVSPGTGGAVSGMEFLAPVVAEGYGRGAFSGAGASILELLNCRCEDAYKRNKEKTYLIDKEELAKARAWTPEKFVAWPSYKHNFETLDTLDGRSDMAPDASLKAVAWLVRDALAAAATNDEAMIAARADRLEYYDAAAAQALRSGIELDPVKADVFRRVEETEQEYFQAVSAGFLSRHLNEEVLTAFLEVRKEEQSQIKTAKTMSWVGFGLNLALAGAASYNGSNLAMSNAMVTMTAMNQVMEDSFANMAQSVDLNQGQFGKDQIKVSMQLADGEKQLSVKNYDDLRRQLQTYYVRAAKPRGQGVRSRSSS